MSIPNRKQDGDPLEGYLRQSQVLEMIGVSRITLWSWRRRGLFPAPRRLGPNTIGWPVETIRNWMSSRPVA